MPLPRMVAPLHRAAHCGKAEVASLLLIMGADVDAVDAAGSTPLKFAATQGDSTSAQALLNAGADISLPIRNSLVGAGLGCLCRAYGCRHSVANRVRDGRECCYHRWQHRPASSGKAGVASLLVTRGLMLMKWASKGPHRLSQ